MLIAGNITIILMCDKHIDSGSKFEQKEPTVYYLISRVIVIWCEQLFW